MLDSNIESIIYTSKSGLAYDIAKVVHELLKERYKFTFSKNKGTWYELQNDNWIICPSAYSLHLYLSDTLSKMYSQQVANYINKIQELTIDDDTALTIYYDIIKIYGDISRKLKTTNFKRSIITECKNLFAES